jgi:hypothetical protein
MSWAAVALGLRLTGVVDRIEGDQAVVCWDADRCTDIPLAVLPLVQEGDGLVVQVRTRRAPREAPDAPHRTSRTVRARTTHLHIRTRRARPTRRPRVAPLPDVFDLTGPGATPDSHRSSP